MDPIASQHEPTVIFLWLLSTRLLACLAGEVCVVSGVLAGCQGVRVGYLLLLSSLDEHCALWLSGTPMQVNSSKVHIWENSGGIL
jgi:hypothetical protein